MFDTIRRLTGGIFHSENSKGPWGGNDGGNSSGSSGGGDGPRNPWDLPPGNKRPRSGINPLDEWMKRTRHRPGGPGNPGGLPDMSMLALLGAAALIALWIALTSFWTIAPNQKGVVTVLGRYTATLNHGFHTTWPAPFASVTKVDTSSVRVEDFPEGGSGENPMLTQDQNIVNLSYQVSWFVKSPEDYVFRIADPKETIRAVAESAMRAAIADVSLDQAIGPGKDAIENKVQQNMQAILDEYHSGIAIQKVAIQQAAPPAKVDDAFKAVTAAQQEVQANLNNARAYAQQVIAKAQGEAAQFDKIYAQYKLAPQVTRRRLYYETMEAVLAKSDKTIIDAPGVSSWLPLPPQARSATPQPAPDPQQPAAPAAGAGQ